MIKKYGIDIGQADAEINKQIEANLKAYYDEMGSYRVIFTGTPKDYTLKVNESLYKLTLEAAVKVNSTMNIDMDIKNIDFHNETINKWMFSGYVVDGTENIFINIIFPQDKIKTIGEMSFDNLYNTKEIVIPDSVISIGKSAFANSHLEKVTISASVKEIKGSAFNTSRKLKTLIYLGTSPNDINYQSDSFLYCDNLTILILPNVPNPDYNTWKNFLGCNFTEVKQHE